MEKLDKFCLNCGAKIIASKNKHNARLQKYCSPHCQKLAGQHRQDLRFKAIYNGGFQWLNSRWSPNPLRDRIWTSTGIENIKNYLHTRYRWMTPSEMAQEINTNSSQVRNLLTKYKLTHKNYYYV